MISPRGLYTSLLTLTAVLLVLILASLAMPTRATTQTTPQPLSYYRVPGLAFHTSSQGEYGERLAITPTDTTIGAPGCFGFVMSTIQPTNYVYAFHSMTIPDHSIIKRFRIYVYDTAASSTITVSLRTYQEGSGVISGTSQILTSVASTNHDGYSTVIGDEITHTVDMSSTAYAIEWRAIAFGSFGPGPNDRHFLCGATVDYYPPPSSLGSVFLPTIQR
jgi:hypothetical protein